MTFMGTQNEYASLINESLPSYLPNSSTSYGEVIKAMEYSLCGGGKRVRGVLTLAFYKLFGGENVRDVLPFAAAVEMIHAYSLIHDDLPCMDDDDMRRGKPSCHIVYGEDTALLAGDGLLTLAFETITTGAKIENFADISVLKAVNALATFSGVNGMIGGQVLDLANEEKSATIDEIVSAELLKTSALITSGAVMGSILAGADNDQLELVKEYGKNLGLAFQVMDDVLDATSTQEKLGKPIGSDEENKKSTFVSLYGVEKAKEIAGEYTQKAVDALLALDKDTEFLINFTNYLSKRDY